MRQVLLVDKVVGQLEIGVEDGAGAGGGGDGKEAEGDGEGEEAAFDKAARQFVESRRAALRKIGEWGA